MSMKNIPLRTLFDRLPTEIIFHIFDYLSNNDIIYALFYFSQRLNNLLLQSQCYLKYLNLPTTNLNIWKNIFLDIGSQIESININTNDLSFSLIYFPNLKSILISSPFGLPSKQLKLILESDQFQKLHSFKLKENKYFFQQFFIKYLNYDNNYIYRKVFNHKNSLEVFQYPLLTPSLTTLITFRFETNLNLHSLTLMLTYFQDIFILIKFTPNLKYLNIHSESPYIDQSSINDVDIKLKEFYLTLNCESQELVSWMPKEIDFNQLIHGIKQFSSSLTCLSINLVDLKIKTTNEIPFNNIKLQQLLESMKELEQFHLCTKLPDSSVSTKNNILPKFNDEFWLNHNWSFGIHDEYLYTLPFKFDCLPGLFEGFDFVKSNNNDILENNPRLWYNVKTIQLRATLIYDLNFIKKLKMKMPKLNLIKFFEHLFLSKLSIQHSYINNNEREKNSVTLDNVTTIQCTIRFIEREREWLIYTLPNLRHVILSCTRVRLGKCQLVPILIKSIQQLDIIICSQLEEVPEIDYVYFSNVKHINFCLQCSYSKHQQLADIIMKILTTFKDLKTLIISIQWLDEHYLDLPTVTEFAKLITCLDINSIMKIYQIKHFEKYCLFSKKMFYI
ncbi:unnamed protein product [Rotaria sordida]|uniref:F-box domain-containing protein n=1 Tax=Rotaria sordida TaxID=392033 RepID=A0A819UB14_9BILA|nr:unnamed protein product [Rotaria sordida]